MRADEVLREPERLGRKILILAREIDRARMSLLPGGIDYSADKVQGNPVDKYPQVMDIILRDEEKLRELTARRRWLMFERIPKLIASIENDLAKDVVRAYYTTDATMAEVCEMCSISNATAYRYRYMGEADIQKVLDTES